ncbi:hypothetical protein CUJ83_12035 [Methanocella sp. CWC-04]|uniref:Uncharacterized protein n=1 Tax=Methanooceanicella nereidis TaxID=2052831 RepID=A0AAP2RE77_9EURY|nr:hypothetical protein [Methanocella sp. CWC-04]MCD1295728.1 hypothetical protein [Methanocella sp. CWC-04]
MKSKIMLITALMVLCFVTPALGAEDNISYVNQVYENKGIQIHFDRIEVSDKPTGYSPINFPSSEYRFIKLYYSLYNPTNENVKYLLNVTIRDDDGKIYLSDEQTTSESIPPEQKYYRLKEFAVSRNSSYYTLLWNYFDWDAFMDKSTEVYTIRPDATATPTPTPVATVTATATPTPTPSPTPSPGTGCMPFLPLGLFIGGVGGMVLIGRNYIKNR